MSEEKENRNPGGEGPSQESDSGSDRTTPDQLAKRTGKPVSINFTPLQDESLVEWLKNNPFITRS